MAFVVLGTHGSTAALTLAHRGHPGSGIVAALIASVFWAYAVRELRRCHRLHAAVL